MKRTPFRQFYHYLGIHHTTDASSIQSHQLEYPDDIVGICYLDPEAELERNSSHQYVA